MRPWLLVAVLAAGCIPSTNAWALVGASALPKIKPVQSRASSIGMPVMQASNAGEALKRLGEIQKAKVSLSKYESYTIKLKKPMGLVFEEYNTVAKGIFVADKARGSTNPDNLRPYSDTNSSPFDEIGVRDTLLRVNDLAGKESDARCLEFDAALSLIAESDAAEMELTFAATGV